MTRATGIELLAVDCNGWCHTIKSGVKGGEVMRILQLEEKREQGKVRQQNVEANPQLEFVCNHCEI